MIMVLHTKSIIGRLHAQDLKHGQLKKGAMSIFGTCQTLLLDTIQNFKVLMDISNFVMPWVCVSVYASYGTSERQQIIVEVDIHL